MDGPVSKSLWIYFVLTLPLTALLVGIWRTFDQRQARHTNDVHDAGDEEEKPETEEEKESRLLEARIMRNIRRRTGVRVAETFELQPSQNRAPGIVP